MKVRNGFISNSSTTSFCIYGVSLDKEELTKAIRKSSGDEKVDVYDILEDLFESTNIEIQSGDDHDYLIGREWSDVQDEETGRQFKENIKNEVMRKLKTLNVKTTDKEFVTHEGSYYS